MYESALQLYFKVSGAIQHHNICLVNTFSKQSSDARHNVLCFSTQVSAGCHTRSWATPLGGLRTDQRRRIVKITRYNSPV